MCQYFIKIQVLHDQNSITVIKDATSTWIHLTYYKGYLTFEKKPKCIVSKSRFNPINNLLQ